MTAPFGEPRYVATNEFNARHVRDWHNIVVGHLIAHVGQPCHLERVFGCNHEEARDAVAAARRLGFVITARRGRSGYTLHPVFDRPRYMRLHTGRKAER